MASRPLVLAAVVVVALVLLLPLAHARRHLRGPRAGDCAIVQVDAARLTPGVLASRRPIVVQDRMVDPASELRRTAFRWQYVRAVGPDVAPAQAQTRARFTLLWFDAPDGGDVLIHAPPACAEPTLVRLARGMVLVLPPGWAYACTAAPAARLQLHDPASVLLQAFPGQAFPGAARPQNLDQK
jgi:hypothetical protein